MIGGDTFEHTNVALDGDPMIVEIPIALETGAAEPAFDDGGAAGPRLAKGLSKVGGVFGEERLDIGAGVGAPGVQVALDPGFEGGFQPSPPVEWLFTNSWSTLMNPSKSFSTFPKKAM